MPLGTTRPAEMKYQQGLSYKRWVRWPGLLAVEAPTYGTWLMEEERASRVSASDTYLDLNFEKKSPKPPPECLYWPRAANGHVTRCLTLRLTPPWPCPNTANYGCHRLSPRVVKSYATLIFHTAQVTSTVYATQQASHISHSESHKQR